MLQIIEVSTHVLLQLLMVAPAMPAGQLHCKEIISRLKFPSQQSEKRIILLHFGFINQSYVNIVLENYSQIRDLHNNQPSFASYVILANFVAVAYNASLESLTDYPANCYDNRRIISEINFISKLGVIKNPTSALIPVGNTGFNFAYCQRSQQQMGNLMVLKIFRGSADFPVWICVTTSLILTTILIKLEAGKEFSEAMLTISSVLISPGMSGTCANSKLFLL